MSESVKRGRPVGSGSKWGEKTHVIRVPESVSSDEVAAMLEVLQILREWATDPTGFAPGTVRDEVVVRERKYVRDLITVCFARCE